TNNGLWYVSFLTNLHVLDAAYCKNVHGEGVEYLSKLKLIYLNLHCTTMSTLRCISDLTSMQHLNIGNDRDDPFAWFHYVSVCLQNMKNLRSLKLTNTFIGIDDLLFF